MTTKALTIVSLIAAGLTTPSIAGVVEVFDDLVVALARDEVPAIVVEPGNEPEPDDSLIHLVDRDLEIRIIVLGRGDSVYSVLDPILEEIHTRMMDESILSGATYYVREGETLRQRDEADKTAGAVTKIYRVGYRTSTGALS